jgi:hypothetical protein
MEITPFSPNQEKMEQKKPRAKHPLRRLAKQT